MQTAQTRLQELFGRWLTQTATAVEMDELMVLMGTEDLSRSLSPALQEAWDRQQVTHKLLAEQKDRIVDEIITNYPAERETFIAPVHRVHFLRTAWFRYAAAIILLVGIGAYYLFTTLYSPGPSLSHRPLSSPQSGNLTGVSHNKAILTLASGKKIELDSKTSGQLVQSDGVEINTPRGSQYQVMLPDGTKAWLNAASSIKFPTAFTGRERRVEVTGEIYFEVKVNKMAPFVVSSKGMEVQVLGTSFNINAYEDEESTKTTLLEGSVRISSSSFRRSEATEKSPDTQRFLANARNDDAGVILKPGEAYLNGKVVETNIEQDIAWKSNLFKFNETPIESIMRQLSRWYNVEVVYKGKINNSFTTTIPRNLPLSQVLRLLELTEGVRFEVEGNKVTVLP